MHTLFILSLIVIIIFYFNRKKLVVLFTKNKHEAATVIEDNSYKTASYCVLAYNAKDFESTKDLENAMEIRLERCITGLAKQGHKAEVEFHSTGFVLVYLVKYWY